MQAWRDTCKTSRSFSEMKFLVMVFKLDFSQKISSRTYFFLKIFMIFKKKKEFFDFELCLSRNLSVSAGSTAARRGRQIPWSGSYRQF